MITLVKRNLGIFVVLLLSFWAIKALFAPGFFPMHDDTQVARVFEMGKALRDGMFPVRWVPDLGYGHGYPIFNFYAPLAYYVGGLFTLLGFDALIATKIMMGIGILLSGIFMYLLAREFWGEMGGVLSGLFYVYAPYHALDIYVRGDVAEFWAYAFIPLMFWGFYKVFKEGKWRYVIIGSLGYAGIILSHNLTAMMVTPFLIIAVIILSYLSYKNKSIHATYYLILATVLGLLISAFYWLPALLEMKYTNVLSQIGGGADFRDHFVCINQLWDSPWGFGGSAPGCIDGLSFKIGKLHILLTLVAFFFGTSQFLKKKRDRVFIIGLSVLGLLISIFLMLGISKPVWETIPTMAFLQYPWRFLLLASFFSSLVSGAVIWFMTIHLRGAYSVTSEVARGTPPRWAMMGSFVVLIVLLINFNAELFNPQTILRKSVHDYTNNYVLKWAASKTSDEFMPVAFIKPKSSEEIINDKLTILQGEAKIDYKIKKTHKIQALLDVQKPATLLVNIADFPAWNVFINKKVEIPARVDNTQAVVVLDRGKYTIDIQFQQTLIEKISNLVSVISIAIIIVGIILKGRRVVSK